MVCWQKFVLLFSGNKSSLWIWKCCAKSLWRLSFIFLTLPFCPFNQVSQKWWFHTSEDKWCPQAWQDVQLDHRTQPTVEVTWVTQMAATACSFVSVIDDNIFFFSFFFFGWDIAFFFHLFILVAKVKNGNLLLTLSICISQVVFKSSPLPLPWPSKSVHLGW